MAKNEVALSNVEAVCRTIDSSAMRDRFEQALPANIGMARFTRVLMTALQQRPELCDADRPSLFAACINAAKDGLLPDGREGALVVFNTKAANGVWVKKVQWLPMVAGVIKRMGEAGIQAYAASVYQNDHVRLWNDETGQHVSHEFSAFAPRGTFVGCYAVALLPDGRSYIESLNLDEIDRIAATSRSGADGPWHTWRDRMAQKSALHRLGRRVPISTLDDRSDRLVSTLNRESEHYAEVAALEGEAVVRTKKPPTRAPKALGQNVGQVSDGPPQTDNRAPYEAKYDKVPVEMLRARLDGALITEAALCEAFEVKSLADLPLSQITEALDTIEANYPLEDPSHVN